METQVDTMFFILRFDGLQTIQSSLRQAKGYHQFSC
jgi:hypothetical protein